MKKDRYCSFCGKHETEVERLIAGPGGIYDCNECIILKYEMLSTPNPGDPDTTWDMDGNIRKPSE